jgi:hypothetical protein
MNFSYSSFISYRRNDGDEPFVKKFKTIIESEAHKVTNVARAFFDEESIKWGNDFDEKIYYGIVSCYFFIPFYHNSYLHKDNLWCAKELIHAIKVEEKIRNHSIPNYCFILPIIYRGSASAFPSCIGKKNAKDIKQLRHVISSNKTSAGLEKLKDNIYETFLTNFNLINGKVNLADLCADIPIATDDEVITWINEQKEVEKKEEATKLPILTKNGE